jgi:ATP-dependent DNA helicase PIF1
MSGDFYQLPPVVRATDAAAVAAGRFCFESADWWNIFCAPNNVVELATIFRQKDAQYAAILNQIREGVIKRSAVTLLANQVNKPHPDNMLIQPTKLFPRRDQVDALNAAEMAALNETAYVYYMDYEISPSYTYGSGNTIKAAIASATKNVIPSKALKAARVYSDNDIGHEFEYMGGSILCDSVLELKKGAQVMCIVNVEVPVWSSGAAPEATAEVAMIGLYNGCQGVVIDFVGGGVPNAVPFPVVRFYKNGERGIDVLMKPHTWESERLSGLSIKQLPLVLSWAITIHKSQGATLDYAEIDIGRNIFEDGQTYVALSRVTSLDGLYLSAFDPTKICVNTRVREFYTRLRAAVTTSADAASAVAEPAQAPDTKTIIVR